MLTVCHQIDDRTFFFDKNPQKKKKKKKHDQILKAVISST